MKEPTHYQPPSSSRPAEVFAAAEAGASSIRKLLSQILAKPAFRDCRGTIDDAVRVARMIEQLSIAGRSLTAEDALDLADKVAALMEQLEIEIESLVSRYQALW